MIGKRCTLFVPSRTAAIPVPVVFLCARLKKKLSRQMRYLSATHVLGFALFFCSEIDAPFDAFAKSSNPRSTFFLETENKHSRPLKLRSITRVLFSSSSFLFSAQSKHSWSDPVWFRLCRTSNQWHYAQEGNEQKSISE